MVPNRAAAALALFAGTARSLDNGVALTPPMGWLAWESFRCEVDCREDPDNCLSERLIRQQADIIVDHGFRDAGYTYINIDDCWLNRTRDATGRLAPDVERFPSGIRALADYVHSKGLRMGIYQDFGTQTCEGYPGMCQDQLCSGGGYMKVDAETFASWGVDSLKVDSCNANHTPLVLEAGYTNMTKFLNQTGRQMVYSCSWPAYEMVNGSALSQERYQQIAGACNMWRVTGDIQNSFDSVVGIIDWAAKSSDAVAPAAGPGRWNDLDGLLVGCSGLSAAQARTQFALWALMASPLLIGADLRAMDAASREILLNREIIALNQDPAGKQGVRVAHQDGGQAYDVWRKDLSNGDVAIAVFNRCWTGIADCERIALRLGDLRLPGDEYKARDLYLHKDMPPLHGGWLNISVVPWDTMVIRLSAADPSDGDGAQQMIV